VVPLYLDDCLIAKQVARQLRAAGHLIYVTSELGVRGDNDNAHLERAAELGAVMVSQNQQDFAPLHHRWQAEGRSHAGILLMASLYIGHKIERLDRVARLLTPEAAQNQLMNLRGFDTEERAGLM